MNIGLSLAELTGYTEWQRQKWHAWFREHGDAPLTLDSGLHGDGRFHSVGDSLKHIFSAEIRYVDRLLDRPVTDAAAIPSDNAEALFEFGRKSRSELKNLIETFAEAEWEVPRELTILKYALTVTPRKIVAHVLMHEIRHWAQIGTLMRLNGLPIEFQDLLFSPVMDESLKHRG